MLILAQNCYTDEFLFSLIKFSCPTEQRYWETEWVFVMHFDGGNGLVLWVHWGVRKMGKGLQEGGGDGWEPGWVFPSSGSDHNDFYDRFKSKIDHLKKKSNWSSKKDWLTHWSMIALLFTIDNEKNQISWC